MLGHDQGAEPLVCVVTDSTVHRFADELARSVDVPVEWRFCHAMGKRELIEAVADASVYVGAWLPAEVARQATKLQLVQSTGVGIDRIALDVLPEGLPVAAVDSHARSVAEHVVMGMLGLSRRLVETDGALREGRWLSGAFDDAEPMGETLRGKTCGLVGYGSIGKEVGLLASQLDMRVGAVRSNASRYGAGDEHLEIAEDTTALPRLLAWADFVVLSIPLTSTTAGLIDRDALDCMRPTARLINVARGPVADEVALYEALRDRRIDGAALDVWYRYPEDLSEPFLPANCPFWELPNVILTPHSSAATSETYVGRAQQIARNINAVGRGDALSGLVGRKAVAS
jgi:phosphoglycerate dehydrogenase-like enzyme